MNYLTALHTDIGIKKDTNQDALLIRQASTSYGPILLAVMCDGMGGLARGEVASSVLTREMASWFETRLPILLTQGFGMEYLNTDWSQLINDVNRRIANYGAINSLNLGTTISALLLLGNQYFIMNIGDSRVYQIKDQVNRLTKDHTYVQREMDAGRMTYEETLQSPERNVLLQCVGASTVVVPDYYTGTFEPDTMFMLCSDGFRHLITEEEMYEHLNPNDLTTEEYMAEQAQYLTELNKYRQETDNISVALIRSTVC